MIHWLLQGGSLCNRDKDEDDKEEGMILMKTKLDQFHQLGSVSGNRAALQVD